MVKIEVETGGRINLLTADGECLITTQPEPKGANGIE